MEPLTTLIVVANTVTLLGGGAITIFATKAHLRTDSPALRALAIGFALVTLGAGLGGIVHQFAAAPILQGVAIQSVFTAIGVAAMAYSLAAEHPSRHTSTAPH